MTTKHSKQDSTLTIGLDIGYGVTKALTNGSTVIFPSVAGHAREIKFKADEIAAKYPGDQIADSDGEWFTGDLALSQLRPGELLRLRGRTADEKGMGNTFRVRLAKVALGKLFPDRHNGEAVHLQVATGLPVDHMRDSADLKGCLIGQHHVQTDLTNFVANITDVMVMPQPYGTIYRKMLTESGEVDKCHTYMRTGVIDVGTYSVDVALDDDGEYIDVASGSIEGGVYLVQEAIASAYERDYRQKPSYRDVETIIRSGCFRIRGETVSYANELREATEPLISATLQLVNDRWGTGANVDVIYLSGGGAALVERAVRAAYPQARLVEDSQLANARGYLNYALFALAQ